MRVRKRNGQLTNFSIQKIIDAISGAFLELDEEFDDCRVINIIEDKIKGKAIKKSGKKEISVEEIQDIVEESLMMYGYYSEAKAYIRYRYQHELERQKKKQEDFDSLITSKLMAADVQNQNANVDEHSFGGRMGEVNSEVLRQYALEHCMSQMARDNHLNNEIYIHDLDHYAVGDHNCLSIPFDKLLAKGFNTRQTDVRPANSINTAFQLVAVIFQLQSLMQFGGVAATHLDWTMVPYVRKSFNKHYLDGMKYLYDGDICPNFKEYKDESIEADIYKSIPNVYKYAIDMTTREAHQAVEGMYHNLKY